jgi:hypothetical protein
VVAIVRDLFADFREGIDEVGPGNDLVFDTIDIDRN